MINTTRYAQYDGHGWHTINAYTFTHGGKPGVKSVAFWVIGVDGYCRLVPGDAVDFTPAEYAMIADVEIHDDLVDESYPLNPARHADAEMHLTLINKTYNPQSYPGFRLIAGYSEWAPATPQMTFFKRVRNHIRKMFGRN